MLLLLFSHFTSVCLLVDIIYVVFIIFFSDRYSNFPVCWSPYILR